MATTEVQLCFPIAQLLSLIVTAAPYTIVLTLRDSLSGTFLLVELRRRKDVVNQCLEFD